MKIKLENKIKQRKGITLIALVVTIIVLLILAGISIQMLVGEGGILTNARDASSETKKGTAKENIDLEIADAILEDKELTIEGLNKHLKEHISGLTHGGQSLTENPIEELPAIVELDGYAFQIDEYGKTSELNGILLSKDKLNLQIEIVGSDKTYGEETLTATLAGISGDITWSKEGEAVEMTESEDGKSVKVTATKTGTATITATCSGKTAKCNVTVEEVKYIDKSYVQYDVGYTDVETGTEYTKNTGWRAITDLTGYEAKGEYTGDVDIISTGIPAKLYYYYSDVSSAPWKGTDEQGTQYLGQYTYSSRTNTDNNIRAVSGLLYNFKNIVFNYKGSDVSSSNLEHNYGGFVDIVTNGTSAVGDVDTTGDSLFTANIASGKIDGIRSVHLGDIKGTNTEETDTAQITSSTDKKPGLFRLDNYTPDAHSKGCYRLASPDPSGADKVRLVTSAGWIGNFDPNAFGEVPERCSSCNFYI